MYWRINVFIKLLIPCIVSQETSTFYFLNISVKNPPFWVIFERIWTPGPSAPEPSTLTTRLLSHPSLPSLPFITLPASIASDRRVMPNSHRSTRRDETNSHNTTYSFIANCQTAVVHKNKTKLKSKIYNSRYILRYNILTVKLQSLIREMRSIVELVASGDVSWVGDSRRESWTVWTIRHGGLDYSLLATQQWHLGQQSVAGSGLTAAAVDRLYRPVCLSSNILLELERFPAFLSDFPDCYRYFWAHPFLFLVPHFLVLISSMVRAVD